MNKNLIKLYERVENLIVKQKINDFEGEKLLDLIDGLYYKLQCGCNENNIKNKINRINKKIKNLKMNI